MDNHKKQVHIEIPEELCIAGGLRIAERLASAIEYIIEYGPPTTMEAAEALGERLEAKPKQPWVTYLFTNIASEALADTARQLISDPRVIEEMKGLGPAISGRISADLRSERGGKRWVRREARELLKNDPSLSLNYIADVLHRDPKRPAKLTLDTIRRYLQGLNGSST